MIVAYEVNGASKTMHVEGFSVEVALTLIPDHGHLTGVQYE